MSPSDPALAALRQRIREQESTDAHIAAKIAAHALLERTFSSLNDGKGVHVESAFALLGSLAGQACLQSALVQTAGKTPANDADALITVSDKQGRQYYYGNPINRPLLENRLSVWSLVGGAVQAHGGQLPDVNDIVRHVTQSIGTPQFGIPRLPQDVEIRHLPQTCLLAWQAFKTAILDALPVPTHDWPLAYALAIQQLMEQGKDVLPPAKAAVIVMECAVPMSKIS